MTDQKQPLVYDISGGYCSPGTSTFNLYTMYDACRYGRIRKRTSQVSLKLALLIYDRLDADDMIDHLPDGSMRWRTFSVSIDQESIIGRQVVDTLISDDEGNRVILRTREY